jgi:hypothetical protein
MLQAQVYTTSSATYHSYSSGGWVEAPASFQFRSTSKYIQSSQAVVYSTAPIQVSNGAIRTVASSLEGGKLAEEQTAYIPTIRNRQNGTMAPPSGTEEYLPLSFDWDAVLLLMLLLGGYACFIACKQKNVKKV